MEGAGVATENLSGGKINMGKEFGLWNQTSSFTLATWSNLLPFLPWGQTGRMQVCPEGRAHEKRLAHSRSSLCVNWLPPWVFSKVCKANIPRTPHLPSGVNYNWQWTPLLQIV